MFQLGLFVGLPYLDADPPPRPGGRHPPPPSTTWDTRAYGRQAGGREFKSAFLQK